MGVLIIAEAGVNHNGSMKSAKRLIDVAVEAGADYVKFQTFKAETLVTQAADKAEYQKGLTGSDETQFEMNKKQKVVLVGAGGGFFDICEELENNDFELIGYINDVEVHDLEYPYLGGDDTVLRDDVVKIVTVAGVGKGIALREKLHEMHKNVIVNLIFNDAIVSRYATYKKNNGIIIYPQTYVKAKCHIGEGVLINSGCIIGHHTKIGDFTQLSLGVNVGGTTSIGKRCFVGMGAQIFNHVTIGDNCIIYAGSIVKKSLPDNSIVRVNNKILDETIV